MEDDEQANDPRTPTAARALGSAIGTGVGNVVDGGTGAVIGAFAAEYTITAAERSWTEFTGRRKRSVEGVIHWAAERVGVDPHKLVDDALADNDKATLLDEALRAAAATTNEQKVAALAKALANGLMRDPASIDKEVLVVRALAQLEAPHIRVLLRLPAARSSPDRNTTTRWSPDAGTPTSRSVSFHAVIHVLEANGLARNNVAEMAAERAAWEVAKLKNELINAAAKRPASVLAPKEPVTLLGWQRTIFGTECGRYLSGYRPRIGLPAQESKGDRG